MAFLLNTFMNNIYVMFVFGIFRRLRVQLLCSWTECIRKIRALLMDSLNSTSKRLTSEWVRSQAAVSNQCPHITVMTKTALWGFLPVVRRYNHILRNHRLLGSPNRRILAHNDLYTLDALWHEPYDTFQFNLPVGVIETIEFSWYWATF